MEPIENALGKKIQITNSHIYSSLAEKYDLNFDLNYENLIMSLGNLSNSLSRHVGADKDKVKLFSTIYGLGKLDGGNATYNYINSRIMNDKTKVSELDVMLHNLAIIFPDCEQRFSQQNFVELANLYSDNPTTTETKIIKICYCLKFLSQKYKQIGALDDKTSIDFIFKNINDIVNHYKQTGVLTLSENLNSEYQKFNSLSNELSDEEKSKLDSFIQNYNDGVMSKSDLINNLNEYRVQKKTKVK